jgi:prepilin peptidase CpaA
LAAAFSDIRRFQIPNAIPLALALLYPIFTISASNLPNPFAALLVAMIVLAVGAGAFAAGLFGAGDVKLMAAVALWTGASACLDFIVLTSIAGALFGLLLLTRRGAALVARLQAPGAGSSAISAELPNLVEVPAMSAWRQPVPYGVAIAIAGLVIVLGRAA